MDTLQVIEKVHSFYSDSFSQLITITIAILAFSGIILPIVIQFIQSKSLKIEQKSLQSFIVSELALLKEELKKDIEITFSKEKEAIQKQLEDEIKKINDKMLQEFAASNGGAFMLQGQFNLSANNIEQATKDYATACHLLIKGKDELNGQRSLVILVENCLPKLVTITIDNIQEIEEGIEILIKSLETVNENGRYYDKINKIKKLLESIKNKQSTIK